MTTPNDSDRAGGDRGGEYADKAKEQTGTKSPDPKTVRKANQMPKKP